MKLKALLLVVFVAGLTSSLALADPGKGHGDKGKGRDAAVSTTTGSTTSTTSDSGARGKSAKCRPSIELELAGTAAGAPAGGSLALAVVKGGAQGAQLAGKQLTLDVSQAKLRGTIASGTLVRVHARACVDLVALTVKLVATEVNAGKGDAGEHTTTSTATTTTP